jgi:hypothetical protein
MTHATGAPVPDNANIMTAGPRGPALAALKADCVMVGGHGMDPATGLDELADIAVDNGRIVALETAEAGGLRELDTKRRIDAAGKIVCPGLIDIHTHVYEWVTNFGIDADDAGVGAGATTVVDQGSAGAWTFAGFEHSIEKAATDVRAFIAPTVAGALLGGCRDDILQGPPLMLIDEMMQVIEKRRHIVASRFTPSREVSPTGEPRCSRLPAPPALSLGSRCIRIPANFIPLTRTPVLSLEV